MRKNSDLVVSYMTLRQMIGFIGLLMPFFVRIGAWFFEGIASTGSISAYYYTDMRDVFVSTLVMVGILMTCSRTPKLIDNLISIVAGLAAAGIGLFPMTPDFAKTVLNRFPAMSEPDKCYVTHGILGYHVTFVVIFFALIFVMVTFRFPAFTPTDPGKEMQWRNTIYRICGTLMALAFVAILILRAKSIFWPETVAVVAFGVAWLVKGQTILKDKPGDPPRTYAAA